MLLGILLAVLIVVCVALVGVILLQRSEGGALGMSGGGPGAFMTARGTGDLLTRTTQILAAVFFTLCLAMTLISGHERNAAELIQKVKGLPPASAAPPAASAAPINPLAPAQQQQPFGQPAQPGQPFGQPRTANPLDLLGTPQTQQAPVAAPQARAVPTVTQPATPKVKVVKAQPPKGPQTPTVIAAPAPDVQPKTAPPPPAAAQSAVPATGR